MSDKLVLAILSEQSPHKRTHFLYEIIMDNERKGPKIQERRDDAQQEDPIIIIRSTHIHDDDDDAVVRGALFP